MLFIGKDYDFNGEVQTGELICNRKIADDLVEIFYELYLNEYLEKMKLIDEYNGDDTASMADNNTSCFNYRVVDGTSSLSKHALGCAIDINPFYNPYIVYGRNEDGSDYISPAGSEIYADRTKNFAYKIDENDLCYKLFKEHGFTWGGDWNSCKDYQHFQKVVSNSTTFFLQSCDNTSLFYFKHLRMTSSVPIIFHDFASSDGVPFVSNPVAQSAFIFDLI